MEGQGGGGSGLEAREDDEYRFSSMMWAVMTGKMENSVTDLIDELIGRVRTRTNTGWLWRWEVWRNSGKLHLWRRSGIGFEGMREDADGSHERVEVETLMTVPQQGRDVGYADGKVCGRRERIGREGKGWKQEVKKNLRK